MEEEKDSISDIEDNNSFEEEVDEEEDKRNTNSFKQKIMGILKESGLIE